MRAAVYVWPKPKGDARFLAALGGDGFYAAQFSRRFHIKAINPDGQCLANFRLAFADAGKDRFVGPAAGRQHAV